MLKIFNKVFDVNEQSNQNYSPIVKKILEHLNKNYSPIVKKILEHLNKNKFIVGGISAIVEDLQYSPSYIRHTFKRDMGVPLSDYIKEIRLNHIAYYLKTTSYSLREICDIVGIESLSYANKIFKEKYSITPIKYRKEFNV